MPAGNFLTKYLQISIVCRYSCKYLLVLLTLEIFYSNESTREFSDHAIMTKMSLQSCKITARRDFKWWRDENIHVHMLTSLKMQRKPGPHSSSPKLYQGSISLCGVHNTQQFGCIDAWKIFWQFNIINLISGIPCWNKRLRWRHAIPILKQSHLTNRHKQVMAQLMNFVHY